MRKISRKGLRNKLDKLVKEYVKKRDNFVCLRCNKKLEGSNCHASHIIPVSAGLMWAYDPENIITLCYHDHINWWHKNPIEATEWLKNAYPDIYKRIEKKKKIYKPRPIKTYELEELRKTLENLL